MSYNLFCIIAQYKIGAMRKPLIAWKNRAVVLGMLSIANNYTYFKRKYAVKYEC